MRDGDTEQRILDAAHVVFLRSGTAGARTQEIAAEAGVNSALLHYYFRSKERLAAAVFRRAAGELFPVVAGILASDLPLEEKVRKAIEVELDRLSRTPYLPAYVISELAYHPERIHQLLVALTGSRPDALGQTVLTVSRRRSAPRSGRGGCGRLPPSSFSSTCCRCASSRSPRSRCSPHSSASMASGSPDSSAIANANCRSSS